MTCFFRYVEAKTSNLETNIRVLDIGYNQDGIVMNDCDLYVQKKSLLTENCSSAIAAASYILVK